MAEILTPDLCVIGAGPGGLSAAMAAAALGVPVVLVEKGRIGGGLLNGGSVPSKALAAAARRAAAVRTADAFGVKPGRVGIEFHAVNDHIQDVVAAAAPNHARARLTGLGVRVIEGEARFLDRQTVAVGEDIRIRAQRFIVATGSVPAVPPIPGLDRTPYLTAETVFESRALPKQLIVIGAGATGLELAQAFRRLGSEVTVLEAARPLANEDEEMVRVLLDALAREGVTLRAGVSVDRVRRLRSRVEVTLRTEAGEETLDGTDLLIATGRSPALDGLALAEAGIRAGPGGIAVDKRLRTTNRRVYAIGDAAALPHRSVHAAGHHADLAIRQALLSGRAAFDPLRLPRAVFTDPELAHVGLTEAQARERFRRIRVLRWPYRENDRALAERAAEGHIKIVTDRRGRILGATIVGAAAGEAVAAWAVALAQGMTIRDFAGIVVPYPTFAGIGTRAAVTAAAPRLRHPWLRRMFGWLRRLR